MADAFVKKVVVWEAFCGRMKQRQEEKERIGQLLEELKKDEAE